MSIEQTNVKPLQPIHTDGAMLFSDRYELLRHIKKLQDIDEISNPNILEIGVALGDFSKFLIDTFTPSRFAAVDLFDLHASETIWGMPTKELFDNKTQIEYFKSKIQSYFHGQLIIEEGYSSEATNRLADRDYDIIYIDAGHDYENVKNDALAGLDKIKSGGYMIFNDYTMMDQLYGTPYGVVQAANELIVDTGRMKVIGLGLNPQMFCDLAVKVI